MRFFIRFCLLLFAGSVVRADAAYAQNATFECQDSLVLKTWTNGEVGWVIPVTNKTSSKLEIRVSILGLDSAKIYFINPTFQKPYILELLPPPAQNDPIIGRLIVPSSPTTLNDTISLVDTVSGYARRILLKAYILPQPSIKGKTTNRLVTASPGDTTCETLTLFNPNSSDSISIDRISFPRGGVYPHGYFVDTTVLALPHLLVPGDSMMFPVCIHLRFPGHAFDTMRIDYSWPGSGGNTIAHLMNTMVYSNKPDTSDAGLFSSGNTTITMTEKGQGPLVHIIRIVNDAGGNLKVKSIQMLGGTGKHFDANIISDSLLPFYLSAGEVMLVQIMLKDDTTGVYDDTLVITTEAGLTSTYIGIHAAREIASVLDERNTPSVRVFTNTFASYTIEFPEAENFTVRIVDILGREITRADHLTGSWEWNGYTSSGIPVPSGEYLVEVSGNSESVIRKLLILR